MQFKAARGNNHTYTHPILPLLADTNGRVAVPNMTLLSHRFQWLRIFPDLQKAWDLYQDRFGQTPRVVASEQSVSPEILPYIAKQDSSGFAQMKQWVGRSRTFPPRWSWQCLGTRDTIPTVSPGDASWDLAIVFRDHRLSDLIGFTYGSMQPKRAAADLVGHLEDHSSNIGKAMAQHSNNPG